MVNRVFLVVTLCAGVLYAIMAGFGYLNSASTIHAGSMSGYHLSLAFGGMILVFMLLLTFFSVCHIFFDQHDGEMIHELFGLGFSALALDAIFAIATYYCATAPQEAIVAASFGSLIVLILCCAVWALRYVLA